MAIETTGTTRNNPRPSEANCDRMPAFWLIKWIVVPMHPIKAMSAVMNVGARNECRLLTIWTASPGAAGSVSADGRDDLEWSYRRARDA